MISTTPGSDETTPKGEPATVLVGTTSDVASRTLAEALIEKHGFESTGIELLGQPVRQKGPLLLVTFENQIIHPPDLDAYFNPQAYVFLSRHYAKSGVPALTAHTTGNFSNEAEVGGNGRELAKVNPDLLKNYMQALWKRRTEAEGYDITIEATHHGPTSLLRPVLFVELGASEKNWSDTHAAGVVADSLVESLSSHNTWERVAVAFGGTHYPDKVNQLLVDSDIAVAFVVPKYSLQHIDEAMLGQMLQKSSKQIRYAAFDWKGMGPHKDKVVRLAEQFGLEVMKL